MRRLLEELPIGAPVVNARDDRGRTPLVCTLCMCRWNTDPRDLVLREPTVFSRTLPFGCTPWCGGKEQGCRIPLLMNV